MVGVSAVRRRKQAIAIGGSGLLVLPLLFMLGTATVGAQEVQAIICRQPAALTIDQPVGDSVAREAEVTVSGSIRQAGQLELYVDEVLDKVVPVGFGDTTFTTTLQLTEGTHTIKGVAVDVCQIGNGEASVVMTYQPLVPEPSVGASVPTEVAGVRIGDPVSADVPQKSAWPPASVGTVMTQLADLFDVAASPTVAGDGTVAELPQPARFVMLSTGALVVIFSQTISTVGVSGQFLQLAASKIGLGSVASPRLLAVILGAVPVVLAFIL